MGRPVPGGVHAVAQRHGAARQPPPTRRRQRRLPQAPGPPTRGRHRPARLPVCPRWSAALARGVEGEAGDASVHRRGKGRVRRRSTVAVQFAATVEVVTGRRLVLFVALSTSRWGPRFRRTMPAEQEPVALSKREREVVRLVALGTTGPRSPTSSDRPRHGAHACAQRDGEGRRTLARPPRRQGAWRRARVALIRERSRDCGIDGAARAARMDSVSPSRVQSRPSFTDQDRSRLRFSFQASSLPQAVKLAAEFGTISADVARTYASPLRPLGRRDWMVVLTTPPMPLTLEVVQLWEEEMLAVEHRWPGCHFLGWTTCRMPRASTGFGEERSGRAGARQRPSQRELVIASLLRCPPDERGGIVHGRAARR